MVHIIAYRLRWRVLNGAEEEAEGLRMALAAARTGTLNPESA